VRLHATFDSCNSGSVMDLPFSYKVCEAFLGASSELPPDGSEARRCVRLRGRLEVVQISG
jgi:hypothetical protein